MVTTTLPYPSNHMDTNILGESNSKKGYAQIRLGENREYKINE